MKTIVLKMLMKIQLTDKLESDIRIIRAKNWLPQTSRKRLEYTLWYNMFLIKDFRRLNRYHIIYEYEAKMVSCRI